MATINQEQKHKEWDTLPKCPTVGAPPPALARKLKVIRKEQVNQEAALKVERLQNKISAATDQAKKMLNLQNQSLSYEVKACLRDLQSALNEAEKYMSELYSMKRQVNAGMNMAACYILMEERAQEEVKRLTGIIDTLREVAKAQHIKIHMLEEQAKGPFAPRVAYKRHLAYVAGKYMVKPALIEGRSREMHVCHARHELYYLMREEGYSFTQIGRICGGKDHTTILHGVKQHKKRMKEAGLE